ncbi:MAG: hypothetical protein ACREYF_28795 [Gammaproteobacteria bacterium]
MIVAVAIAFTVRYATNHKFRTTPMDYFIIAGIATIAVFGERYLQFKDMSLLLVKTVILLYGCELIIDRAQTRCPLNMVTAVALGVFAYKGLT